MANKMPHQLMTVLWLVAASILYLAGMSSDAKGMVVIGMCFEGIFWTRVIRKRDKSTAVGNQQID